MSPVFGGLDQRRLSGSRSVVYRVGATLVGRLSVIDLCQLSGQNGNRTLDIIPACTHRSCGDGVGEMRWVPNLNSFQNGIDAAVEAGDYAFEPLDQVLNSRCRNSIVLNLPSFPNLASNDTLGKACANAPWVIPALGLCCLKIVLLHDVLLQSSTFAHRISKFRPGTRKKPAKGAGPCRANGMWLPSTRSICQKLGGPAGRDVESWCVMRS